uniref:uncharacterized protein LOC105351090 n=1 Tax=Fragaria vesca subsp. vesca TaxID=101020 RepID=UPI0005CA8CBA|nr:PREDICTED: uncharacterized protein LOC105351090 [Fragaria vesca subsp. vesca]
MHGCLYMQMCLLKYNYCECKGCDKDFAKFQKLVVEKYKVPNPSLDKQHRIVTVMGTSDATGLTKLLKKATGKKHVDILPNPVMEASEAEKRNKDNNKSQEEANRPQQQQQHQPPPDATNLGERGIGGRTSGNMHNVGESSAMGQMEQRQQYSRVNNNQESAWNYFNDENSNSCTICESGAKLAS